MDADKPKLSTSKRSINLGQGEFEISRARSAAEKVRRIAENDALNLIQPADNIIVIPTR